MTDEEEFAARSQLKWTREGDAWILLARTSRAGRLNGNSTTSYAATRSAVPSYRSLSAMSAMPFALAAAIRPFTANAAWSAKDRLSVVATIRKSAGKLSAAALGGLERARVHRCALSNISGGTKRPGEALVWTLHSCRGSGENLLGPTGRSFGFDQGNVMLRIMRTQRRVGDATSSSCGSRSDFVNIQIQRSHVVARIFR